MTTKIANGISNNTNTVLATKEALNKALNSIDNQVPDLVMIFASTIYDLDLVLKTVKEVSKSENIVGASSSGEFTQEKAITSGIAITVIKSDSMIFQISKADNFKNRYEEVAEQCFSSFKEESKKMLQNGFRFPTVLILSDGLVMSRGEELIKSRVC